MATDDLFEAERLIRGTIADSIGKERTLRICKWLFTLNKSTIGHVIKCYSRNDRSIRFGIDTTGRDCDVDKVGSLFVTIKNNFQIHILPPDDEHQYAYLKPDGKYYRYIPKQYCIELPMAEIERHILESYYSKLDKLGMGKPKAIINAPNDTYYLPTKADIEFAHSQLRKKLGEGIDTEAVIDQVKVNFDDLVKTQNSPI